MKRYIPVVTRSYSEKINIEDIFFIMQRSRKLVISTDNGVYEYNEKIDNVKDALDKRFCSCLKYFIINFDKVHSMSEQTIFFENGEHFYLGRESYIGTRQKYSRYIKESK
ncbi:MAG: LytTR family transcriptional regulator DNA-binding domain-containing protein [Anaerovoracaceae bacterium]